MGVLDVLLVAAAALWGAAAGALLPRAAYRFSRPRREPWRDRCPGGIWYGDGWGRCGACAAGGLGTRWRPLFAGHGAARSTPGGS
ncbi:hypothetical protein SFUMM280S_05878 [Streptomyces fumanus]